jgi:multimeric flavodoxin WrbA
VNPGPRVVALVGSPRRTGNTVFAVGVATQELERRGVRCETILLCDLPISLAEREAGRKTRTSAEEQVEAVLDRVWAADGVILATPIHFSNVSAQMKAFMDVTNDRYMTEDWLAPRVVGLLAIGAHVFTSTIDAMRRYVDLIAPSHPPVVVATGHADAVGEAQSSEEVRKAALAMAGSMADILLG